MTRVIVYLLCSAAFVVLTPTASMGQEFPHSMASSSHWAESSDSRRTQAAEWLSELSTIDKQIPMLSPAEEAWLKAEYEDEIARNNGHVTSRAWRARNGKEGRIHFAKPIVADMIWILTQLASSSPLTPILFI